jgi:serine/threonine-protein phosphatase 2A regulatory subunit B''
MIVDRIFDAAPRPFEQEKVNREFLSYEDFIYFMLSGKKRKRAVCVHC